MTNHNQKRANESIMVGLRDLTDEDIELITNHSLTLIQELVVDITKRDVEYYDISIDISSGEELQIDLDISLNSPNRWNTDEEELLNQVLETAFLAIEKYLKENFSR